MVEIVDLTDWVEEPFTEQAEIMHLTDFPVEEAHTEHNEVLKLPARPDEEATKTSNPFPRVENEPKPVIARCKSDLIEILVTWILEYPGMDPPGLTKYIKDCFTMINDYLRWASLADTQEQVRVERFRIGHRFMGWMLKKNDGSCMLVECSPCGWDAWLGGTLGFTPIAMVHDKRGARQTTKRGARQITNTPQKTFTNQPSVGNDNGLDVSPHDSRTSVVAGKKGDSSELRGPFPNIIKAEYKPPHTPIREASPPMPLSSIKTVKRVHWPPRYITPPYTPLSKTTQQKRYRSPSHDSGSYSPSVDLDFSGTHQPRISKPRAAKAAKKTKANPPKRARLLSSPKPLAETPPDLSAHKQQTPNPELSSAKNIAFHFFLAEESFGAIPKAFESCKTLSSFFTEALAAWGALGTGEQQPRMMAVKVVVEGLGRPILVLWENKEGYDRMMDMVENEAVGKEILNVEIRCITKV